MLISMEILKHGEEHEITRPASFRARAAATLAACGKSSLPRKNRRMFLNTSGQKGMAGAGSPVA